MIDCITMEKQCLESESRVYNSFMDSYSSHTIPIVISYDLSSQTYHWITLLIVLQNSF